MKRLLFAAALLCAAMTAHAQSAYYAGTAVSQAQVNGVAVLSPAPGSYLTICLVAGTNCTTATVYSDQALTKQIPQPFHPDASGNFGFWAPAGVYRFTQCANGNCATYTMAGGLGAGSIGPQGVPGSSGAPGPAGQTPTVQVGTVTALPCSSAPTVSTTPTSTGIAINLGLPSGCSGSGVSQFVAVLPDTQLGKNYLLSVSGGRLNLASTTSPATATSLIFPSSDGHSYTMTVIPGSVPGRLTVSQN